MNEDKIILSNEDIEEIFGKIYNLIRFGNEALRRPNCNDCAISKTCQDCPKPGDFVVINCPRWVKEQGGGS